MSAVEETTYDEGADTLALIEADSKTQKQKKAEAATPRGFDRAALFLLDLMWDNLFDPTGDRNVGRCKGCGQTVRYNAQQKHHAAHKRNRDRLAKQPDRPYRDTDKSTPDNTSADKKEKDMPSTTSKPKVKKTEVARNAAIAALTKIGRQATMAEIIAIACKDSKVKSADVPDSTIAAQVNFELQEKKPRVVRVSRGVYALKGNEKKPLSEAEAPVKATPAAKKPSASKKTTAAKPKAAAKPANDKAPTAKAPAAANGGGDLATVKADPKPLSEKRPSLRSSRA